MRGVARTRRHCPWNENMVGVGMDSEGFFWGGGSGPDHPLNRRRRVSGLHPAARRHGTRVMVLLRGSVQLIDAVRPRLRVQ